MPDESLWSIEAPSSHGPLRAYEPTWAEVLAAAPALARFNNDSHNAAMMTNSGEMTATNIVEFYQDIRAAGGRPFLLECDGMLLGDADLRNVVDADAEFAILVGVRTEQSRGLGTSYAAMVHQVARLALGIRRVFVTIIPANLASRRMVEKLGYRVDESPYGLSLVETEDDIAMSIDWQAFDLAHADFLSKLVIARRDTGS